MTSFPKKLFSLFVLTLLTTTPALAQNVIGDWNNDGRSDIAVAITYRAGTANIPYVGTDWAVRQRNSDPLFFHFSQAADALVTGRYFDDEKIYPGIVRVVDISTPLEWTIKTPAQGEVVVNYGLPGDRIMNQSDLDCDGLTDFAVARAGTGDMANFLYWYVSLSSSGGRVIETQFGLKDDVIFTADRANDGCAELVVLRKGTWQWFSRTLLGQRVTQVQWGLPGDFPLAPQDLNGDGKADYAISRVTDDTQTVYVRFSGSSQTATAFEIPTNAIPVLGKFLAGNKSSIAFWTRSTGRVAFAQNNNSLTTSRFGIATNALVRPDGTVVQPNETGRVEDGSSTEVPPTDGGSTEVPPGLSAVCSTVIPFSAGSLWKPSSDHSGFPREGRPSMLYNRNIPTGNSCLKVFANNGQTVSELGVYEYNGKYGGRWYTGWGCGDQKYASEIASAAQSATGSELVYVQRQPGVCVGPFNPRNRNGGLA